MSTDSTVTEVLETVEADPDAILDAYDVETPEELIESAGEHEATTDPVIDADDETAETLFARLQVIAAPSRDANGRRDGPSTGGGTSNSTPRADDPADQFDSVFVSEPSVAVRSETDEHTADSGPETTDSVADAAATERKSAETLSLVGPDPTATRVSNDTFGTGDSTDDAAEFQWTESAPAETHR
ncbi:hypothetical protein [Natrinema caseinilyticum]|uniref:hypothetical protein n=1 Tax=Natrinema caseinilyticum TaxID=2961570 RepID=UPI0020C55CB8|nr:hypothetical protein [Natrinema caseinilyticum]